jgi:hypothetical protein
VMAIHIVVKNGERIERNATSGASGVFLRNRRMVEYAK